ncbi:hypothetical protein [Shewanella algae]|uniref:hypothetical protein n=1 Tax=Shewanella algae TaxID=38313 RepID=UPI003007B7A7
MHEKVNRWLDIAERILNLIRPKAYNTIAKVVVITGITLIVESKVKIIHGVYVALFEEYIGKNDFLRSIVESSSDPSTGIALVVIGMFYHIIVTLGKDIVETKKAELPKYPTLDFFFLNGDKKKLESEFMIRGKLAYLPDNQDIPDQKKATLNRAISFDPSLEQTVRFIECTQSTKHLNLNFYRQRATLLRKWAGAELLYLNISNTSKVLASGVTVELEMPRQNGLSITIPEDVIPQKPEPRVELTSLIGKIQSIEELRFNPVPDLEIFSDTRTFKVKWRVNRLQANTSLEAKECLLLKTENPVDIQCTIFCDELPAPMKSVFKVHPPKDRVTISTDELSLDDHYDSLCNNHIMDGYIERYYNELSLRYTSET